MTQKLALALLLLAFSAPAALAQDVPQPGAPQPWWSEQAAGWLGGIVGGSLGLLGAAFGICAGLGVARRVVQFSALAGALVGVIILLIGVGALASGQPYHVYYPALLIGGIMAFVFGLNYPIIKRRNEQMELQKMTAMDA
ncbi:MAG: hypothetical protein HYX68_26680 [Planctomycetes bacterium]|nr:hypothetical protein [Planctomycetota bacterium]